MKLTEDTLALISTTKTDVVAYLTARHAAFMADRELRGPMAEKFKKFRRTDKFHAVLLSTWEQHH